MKTYRFISLAAVCLLSAPVFFSCAKEDVPSPAEEEPGISVLFAEIDQQTKVYLGEKETQGYPLKWDTPDRITVWRKTVDSLGHYKLSQGAGTMCAQFTLSQGSGVQNAPVYAFYPYDNTFPSGNTIDFQIVREQNYKADSFGTAKYDDGSQHGVMPMAASCESPVNMKFSPLMSVLKIQLKDSLSTHSVSSIVLRTSSQNLSASDKSVNVDLTNCFVDVPEFTWTAKKSSNYVTLNCNSVVPLSRDSTSFYIVVPAGDYTDFTVLIHTEDGKVMKKSLKAKDGSVKFSRNVVKAMPALQFIPFDYKSIHYIERDPDPESTHSHDYGPGVMVGGVYWAPVNCGSGFDEEQITYPHGLVYQWGRRHGQDPNPNNSCQTQDLTFDKAQCDDYAQYHAEEHKVGNDRWVWYSGVSSTSDINDALWNQNIQYPLKTPLKSTYDPCPDGWRVPTKAEAQSLSNVTEWTELEDNGISCSDGTDDLKFYPFNYHDRYGANSVSVGSTPAELYIWTGDYDWEDDNGAPYQAVVLRQGTTTLPGVSFVGIINTEAHAVRCVYDGL